jgi:hypothetical protein
VIAERRFSRSPELRLSNTRTVPIAKVALDYVRTNRTYAAVTRYIVSSFRYLLGAFAGAYSHKLLVSAARGLLLDSRRVICSFSWWTVKGLFI